ncbi:MAG: cobaltochelatase subunit CobN [Porticoccaceae bacterium]
MSEVRHFSGRLFFPWLFFQWLFFQGLGPLLFLLLALPASARADAPNLVIIPGDPTMRPLAAAVAQLRNDVSRPELANVHIQILPSSRVGEAELSAIAAADVFIFNNPGREALRKTTPAIQALLARGGRAYALGSPVDGAAEAGLVQDTELRAYVSAGGADNLANMLRRVLAREFGMDAGAIPAPRPFPSQGLWNPRSNRVFEQFEDYVADYSKQQTGGEAQRPWVGILFNRVTAQAGVSPMLEAMMTALERRGYNVAPAFGYPSDVPARAFFVDGDGKPRTAAIIALAMKMGHTPDSAIPAMEQAGVPLINAISLYEQSVEEWRDSALGLSLGERSWQVATAEFAGAIAPTVMAGKEPLREPSSGLEYMEEMPIPERVERLVERVHRWAQLQRLANADKRVAVIYYNYPPGKENIGASYLNVLPRSLWQIYTRLRDEGYSVSGGPETEQALFERVRDHGSNIGLWAPGALEQLVRGKHVELWPVAEYRKWFDRQPKPLRTMINDAWGEPEASTIMTWRDSDGAAYFVFPVQRFGGLLFAPQPSRGSEQQIDKLYHDVMVPPHHQYLAFYLWLQHVYDAHAMVHVGTHASHEWLPGKEVGFTPADPPEAMVGAVPQLYPYIVDDIGEALQAKRRGMATIISHMTPPFDKTHLNSELVRLKQAFSDYAVAAQKSDMAAAAQLAQVEALANELGVLADLGLDSLEDERAIEEVEHYLKEIHERDTPYGLHTFGVAADEALRIATADAILSLDTELAGPERERRRAELVDLLETSAAVELNALVAGLEGRYIAAGPGNDPLRNPSSLPTGRNLYGFNPDTLPTRGAWEQGAALAEAFVADYLERHDSYPDRVVFNLWSTEAMRHEGVTEAEILALLGVRPRWDAWGRVSGVELIERAELGRPRVDVTIVPSGLYRDTLPNLMLMLDMAVDKVKDLEEEDNPVIANVRRVRALLREQGVSDEEAARMAAVRLFTEPSGTYGTGLDGVIQASNSWDDDAQVAAVYFNRVGHLFGQGYWGERPGAEGLAVDIFKMALSGAKAAIHSRASHLYGTLDNDDVFQYLGGTALAIRQVNGAATESVILDLASKDGPRHESLERYLGRELRSRYTNPEWVKAMLDEGYAGARFVMKVTEHLWGWQVTNPEAVSDAHWQEMYETYVADRENLDIRERFRSTQNLLAYQAMVDKMLVAINKGYWQAADEVREHLNEVNAELIAEAGVACNLHSCSSAEVIAAAQAQDARAMEMAMLQPAPAPGAAAAVPAQAAEPAATASPGAHTTSAPPPATAQPQAAQQDGESTDLVEGFEVQRMSQSRAPASAAPAEQAVQWLLVGCLLLIAAGFAWNAVQTRRQ